MRALLATTALTGLLALAGCGDGGDEDGVEPMAGAEAGPEESGEPPRERGRDRQASPRPEKPGTTITTADSQFGEVLFDGDGQAIYYFDREDTSRPRCYGSCAAAWPPVLTKGEPRASGGVAQGKLGTTRRSDGSLQVTYDGHPLYLYAHEGPDVVTCHDVAEFGGLWLAVQPSGAAVA